VRPQGEPVVRSESSSGRRGRIVSKSSETTRLLCALGSWAPRLQPHEWDMAGAIEMSARSGKSEGQGGGQRSGRRTWGVCRICTMTGECGQRRDAPSCQGGGQGSGAQVHYENGMRRVCTGTPARPEPNIQGTSGQARDADAARCTGTPVHCEQTSEERVARPGRRMLRVCPGTPVHYERTVCTMREQ
jgi:hypothetical protein